MNYLIAFLVFGFCFVAMAVGVIFAKKILRKGCSVDPNDPNASCACEEQEKTATLDADLLNIHPKIKK